MTGDSGRRLPALCIYYGDAFVAPANGSQARCAEFLRLAPQLAKRVVFYMRRAQPFSLAEQARFAATFPGVEMVVEPATRRLRLLQRAKNAALQAAPERARAILSWRAPGATPRYDAIRRELPHAPWFINYVDGLAELNGIPAVTIIETHDAKFAKVAKRRELGMASMPVTLRWRSEVASLDAADASVAIAPNEAALFRLMTRQPIFYVPKWSTTAPDPSEAAHPSHDLIFVGSGNAMNVAGLTAFLNDHGAWLARRRLLVCGDVGADGTVREAAARVGTVTLAGRVDDLASHYAKARLAISPVEGTGMKIKVVEALEHGLPVLGSQHALDGLPPGYEGAVGLFSPAAADRLLDDQDAAVRARAAVATYAAGLTSYGERTAFIDFLLSLPAERA